MLMECIASHGFSLPSFPSLQIGQFCYCITNNSAYYKSYDNQVPDCTNAEADYASFGRTYTFSLKTTFCGTSAESHSCKLE